MPTVKGTDKIKGVLDIGVKQQIGKGQHLYLTADEFYEHKVQTALTMKLIVCDESEIIRAGDGNKVRIKNIYHNTISIGEVIRDLKPGQITVLNEEEVRTPYVQAALSKKMLKLEGGVMPGTESASEKTIKVGNVFDTSKSAIPSVVSSAKDDELETNEEIISPPRVIEMDSNVIDEPNPPAVTKTAVADPRKKAVIWNPANNPTLKQIPNAVVMKGRTQKSKGTPENDSEFMEKVASGELKPNGTPNTDEDIIVKTKEPSTDMSFVDQEQEKERIANHPKLSNKATDQNKEINFIG